MKAAESNIRRNVVNATVVDDKSDVIMCLPKKKKCNVKVNNGLM